MGTISRAKAVLALSASGAPTKTNVSGAATIGIAPPAIEFPDANIAYSLKITATGDEDEVTISLADYTVTNDTGTPTITDPPGVDFEGVSLADTAELFAVMAITPSTNTSEVELSGDIVMRFQGAGWIGKNYGTLTPATPSTVTAYIETSGESVEILVIGKTA
jgi:hypothetical protein